jgi:hypothetical protein
MNAALILILLFTPAAFSASIEEPERRGLQTSRGKFIVRGAPAFLLGISYFDAMTASQTILEHDFTYLKSRGFNAVRVWATWYSHHQPRTISLIRRNGTIHPIAWSRMKRVLEVAKHKGFVVNVTFSRDAINLISVANYKKGIRAAAILMKPYKFVMFDVQNETNHCGAESDPGCTGHLTLPQVAEIRSSIREIDPTRLVTASRNGFSFLPGDDYVAYRNVGKVDFIATHRPGRTRNNVWAQITDEEVQLIKQVLGTNIPVLFDEPNRCGQNMDCSAPGSLNTFLNAARNAKGAGAAGWFFHTTAGFRLHAVPLTSRLTEVELKTVNRLGQALAGL